MADKVRCDSCGRYLDATLMCYEHEPQILCQDCMDDEKVARSSTPTDELKLPWRFDTDFGLLDTEDQRLLRFVAANYEQRTYLFTAITQHADFVAENRRMKEQLQYIRINVEERHGLGLDNALANIKDAVDKALTGEKKGANIDANERYEKLARQFYDETGIMAPGKDVAAAAHDSQPSFDERFELWIEWLKEKGASDAD